MFVPRNVFEWRDLWADLLRGVGTGLLELDGSHAAQAALAGLEVFNEAQQRRPHVSQHDLSPGLDGPQMPPWPLSQGPADGGSYQREWGDADAQGAGTLGYRTILPTGPILAPRHQPMSPNPIEGWSIGSILPLGPDGRLNIPSFRR